MFLQRFAATFCLLVLLSEVHPLTYEDQERVSALKRRVARDATPEDVIALNGEPWYRLMQPAETHSLGRVKHTRKKRWVTIALIALTMAVGLAVDIALHVQGCCKFDNGRFSKICWYQDEFNKAVDTMKTKIATVNDIYNELATTGLYADTLNELIGELWKKMTTFDENQERIIKKLDSNVSAAFIVAKTTLESKIQELNITLLTLNDVKAEFELAGMFDTVQSTMLRLTPFFALGGFLILTQLIQYSATKYAATWGSGTGTSWLSVKTKGLVDGVTYYKNKATGTNFYQSAKAKLSVSEKTAGRMRTAGNVFIVGVTIGLEIWQIVEKVDACRKIQDSAKKAYDSVAQPQAELTELNQNATNTRTLVTESYNSIKGQLTSNDFMTYVGTILDLAAKSSNQSTVLVSSQALITSYLNGIATTDRQTAETLTRGLVDGFGKINYKLDCLYKHMGLTNTLNDDCAFGTNDASTIYDNYMASVTTCQGELADYFSKPGIISGIKANMTAIGKQSDCVRNNVGKARYACEKWLNTDDKTAIMNELNTGAAPPVDIDQVNYFTSNCKPADVNAGSNIATAICYDKNYQSVTRDQIAAKYNKYDSVQVLSTFDGCPQKDIDKFFKEKICNEKNNGVAAATIIADQPLYNSTQIQAHYDQCIVVTKPPVTDMDKQMICLLKANGFEDFSAYAAKYGQEQVDEVIKSCSSGKKDEQFDTPLANKVYNEEITKLAKEHFWICEKKYEGMTVPGIIHSMTNEVTDFVMKTIHDVYVKCPVKENKKPKPDSRSDTTKKTADTKAKKKDIGGHKSYICERKSQGVSPVEFVVSIFPQWKVPKNLAQQTLKKEKVKQVEAEYKRCPTHQKKDKRTYVKNSFADYFDDIDV